MNSNDYNIVKIRYYADNKYMKAFHDENHKNYNIAHKKHWEAAENYNEFFWNFVEYVIGRKLFPEYGFSQKDCITELLYEDYGIIIKHEECYYTYLIPKKDINIYEWILNNSKTPIKELKKVSLFWQLYETPSRVHRDYAKPIKIND